MKKKPKNEPSTTYIAFDSYTKPSSHSNKHFNLLFITPQQHTYVFHACSYTEPSSYPDELFGELTLINSSMQLLWQTGRERCLDLSTNYHRGQNLVLENN